MCRFSSPRQSTGASLSAPGLRRPIIGPPIPPPSTPFKPDLSIHFERYIAHCRALLKDGVHGLAGARHDERSEFAGFQRARSGSGKLVASGISADKLLPGTGAASIGDAVRLTKHAVNLGVRGVLLLPPFYYKGVSDDGLFAFVSEVIARVGDPKIAHLSLQFSADERARRSPNLIDRLLKKFPELSLALKIAPATFHICIRCSIGSPASRSSPQAKRCYLRR